MAITMYVTYNCYKNGEMKLGRVETACFSAINSAQRNNNNNWDSIEVKVKCSDKMKPYYLFWLNLIKTIEPKCKLVTKKRL